MTDIYDEKAREIWRKSDYESTVGCELIAQALREIGQERDKLKKEIVNLTGHRVYEIISERDSLKSALDLSTQMTEERDMQIDSLKQKLGIAREALEKLGKGNRYPATLKLVKETLAKIEGK